MCKIENIFGVFLDIENANNDSIKSVDIIFDVLEVGFKIFDRFENFTPSRNKV